MPKTLFYIQFNVNKSKFTFVSISKSDFSSKWYIFFW